MAGRIFISYRRDDVRADARDLAGRLSRAFGERNVFMDVDNLLVGQRFDKELEAALAQCDIFIAVIGRQWAQVLAERQASGERDFVVDEITAAIERDIVVIPVLVDSAALPHQDTLPAAISALPFYQTHELKHESFGRDAEALIAEIKAVRAKQRRESGGGGFPWGRLAGGLAALAIAIAGVFLVPMAVDWWSAGRDDAAAVKVERARQVALMEQKRQEAARKAEAERKAADAAKKAEEARKVAAARKRREAEARKAAAAAKAKREAEEQGKRELAERKAREAREQEARSRDEARKRAEGRIPVKVGLPGNEQTRWLKPGAGRTEWFKDCAECPEMVVVPAGSFLMGSPQSEVGRHENEGPQHLATITKPFAVGRFEVTRGHFTDFVKSTGHTPASGCWMEADGKWKVRKDRSFRNPGFEQDGSHPTVCVNWRDAVAYAAWISEKTKRSYRLLSEVEWEYVARGKTSSPYWWGKNATHRLANYGEETCCGGAIRGEDKWLYTAPVGKFPPNPFGLFDVHGNVWEWVQDCWVDNVRRRIAAANEAGDCRSRVARGGSWESHPPNLRSANRSWAPIWKGNIYRGFRVARTLDLPPLRATATPPSATHRTTAQIIKQRVNLRSAPGTLSKSLGRLDVGEIVSLLSEVKGRYWWKVQASDGQIGYVKKDEVRALTR